MLWESIKLLLCLGVSLVSDIKETVIALAKNKTTTGTYLFTTILLNGNEHYVNLNNRFFKAAF